MEKKIRVMLVLKFRPATIRYRIMREARLKLVKVGARVRIRLRFMVRAHK